MEQFENYWRVPPRQKGGGGVGGCRVRGALFPFSLLPEFQRICSNVTVWESRKLDSGPTNPASPLLPVSLAYQLTFLVYPFVEINGLAFFLPHLCECGVEYIKRVKLQIFLCVQ